MATKRYEDGLFRYLEGRKKSELLVLLRQCYRALSVEAREQVFGQAEKASRPASPEVAQLLADVQAFDAASRRGVYYAPFDVSSKNYSHIPEETEEWCDLFGRLAQDTVDVFKQGELKATAGAFGILFPLLQDAMYEDAIIFADELGDWLIPVKLGPWMRAGLRAAGQLALPTFVELATQVVRYAHYDGPLRNVALRSCSADRRAELREALA